MAKRKSKVPEKIKDAFSSRIKEFAGAIHSYGIEKLYDELTSRACINASYPIETFRTDFKRMKSGGNGLLNEPSLLGGILEILHFPADALFGGPTSNIEDTRKMIEKTVSNTLQDFKKQWNTPQKRIFGPRIIARAYQVYCIIENIVWQRLNGHSPVEPIMSLFVWYSSKDKTWNHVQEKRITAILDRILTGAKGYIYYQYQYFYFNPPHFPQDVIDCDTHWNLWLIIAYQLSCIESVYSIYKKSKTIKPIGQKGPVTTVISPKLTQNITSGGENSDGFAFELRNFCGVFDNLFETDTIQENFVKKLEAIIQNFQMVLFFLLNPAATKIIQKNSMGNSPVYNFIKPDDILEIHSEIKITNNEINILKKSIDILQDKIFPLDNQNNVLIPNKEQERPNNPSDSTLQKSQEETQKKQEQLGRSLSSPAMLPDTEILPKKNQFENLPQKLGEIALAQGDKKTTNILPVIQDLTTTFKEKNK